MNLRYYFISREFNLDLFEGHGGVEYSNVKDNHGLKWLEDVSSFSIKDFINNLISCECYDYVYLFLDKVQV